jgi:hypothetical protein
MYPFDKQGDPFIRDHWRALIFALVMFIVFLKGAVPLEFVIFLIIAATLIYIDRQYPVRR